MRLRCWRAGGPTSDYFLAWKMCAEYEGQVAVPK
jgi:hypothetical protein